MYTIHEYKRVFSKVFKVNCRQERDIQGHYFAAVYWHIGLNIGSGTMLLFCVTALTATQPQMLCNNCISICRVWNYSTVLYYICSCCWLCSVLLCNLSWVQYCIIFHYCTLYDKLDLTFIQIVNNNIIYWIQKLLLKLMLKVFLNVNTCTLVNIEKLHFIMPIFFQNWLLQRTFLNIQTTNLLCMITVVYFKFLFY